MGFIINLKHLVEWISVKSVAIGTAVPNKPVESLNALTDGMLSKPVDSATYSAKHAVGHCAPHSVLIALSETEVKPWKTAPKVSNIVSLPAPLIVLLVSTVATTVG